MSKFYTDSVGFLTCTITPARMQCEFRESATYTVLYTVTRPPRDNAVIDWSTLPHNCYPDTLILKETDPALQAQLVAKNPPKDAFVTVIT